MENKHSILIRISLWLTALSLSSCTFIYPTIFTNPDTENIKGVESNHNDDNIVFIVYSSFRYECVQIVDKDTIDFSMELLVIPGNFNSGTTIKYKFQYNLDQLTEKQKSHFTESSEGYGYEITSVNEDKTEVWLHPPRSLTLMDLEIAPFPTIQLNENADSVFTLELFVGPGWGKYSWTKIESNYKTDKIIISSDSTSKTFEVQSYSKRKEEILCRAYFVYSSEKGFVSMDYKFMNGNRIIFNLID